ncbi:ornithine cyclodeaminase [Bacillus mesophilus]|uniref:Ornithine cyclodeaminase family protein n=1 Tax=Bacillus mesophilus TaxID=1808955 RepID=A0A6M0QBG8_9BACI|nr:ornithine cyclodeaminase family protein [Bacillus mesophilus]MBM7663003.1 ornithine cyclodeaminase [Bacillus mesophilus]NEY73675.1 ornithine cyclodeaminase family protein [Bacillus mesophilus]
MNFFNEEQIKSLVSIKELTDELEVFYRNKTEVIIPERLHLDDGDNTVLIMPAFDPDYYAIKLVGVAPHNKVICKPSIHGTVILHNRHTLEPLAMFDGPAITSLRTGAIGGLAMRYLARESAESIGIVGTGIQGWSHLEAALGERNIKKVYLYNRSNHALERFKKRLESQFPDQEVSAVNVEELTHASDIIVTTTTSDIPVLPDIPPKLLLGKLIVAVGSFKPTMQEIPNPILRAAHPIYVDTLTALKESGDMKKAQELQGNGLQIQTLDNLVNFKTTNSTSPFILFKSVGMSLFDLLTVKCIYERSSKQ